MWLKSRICHVLRTAIHVRFSSTQLSQEELVTSRLQGGPGIFQLTLARHSAKNAFSKSLLSALEGAINNLKSEPEARVVILASDVPGVFCAGADLKERAKLTQDEVEKFVHRLRSAFTALAELPVPVIAAIDGAALGGGLELALAADLRVATNSSKLGLPETRLAIIPGAGGTQRLPRLINPSIAKEIIFTGRVLTGAEAERIGLVNHVVESDSLGKAREIAELIARNGPLAVRAAKRAINRGTGLPLISALQEEREAYATIVPTSDRLEGLQAFKEKRSPKYTGN